MKYDFKLDIYTDGDFGFKYIPRDMVVNFERYTLKETFDSREKALDYINETINFLREHISGKDYVIENFKKMLDRFYIKLKNRPQQNFYLEEMYGNYEGTCIELSEVPNRIKLDFGLTDEEYELYKSVKHMTIGDVKDAFLDKCKELKEKYKNVNQKEFNIQ